MITQKDIRRVVDMRNKERRESNEAAGLLVIAFVFLLWYCMTH